MTFISEVSSSVAKALLENAVFLTVSLSPLMVGNSSAPSARPASNLAAIRGASPLPENELDSTSIFEPVLFTASAMMLAYAWFTKEASCSLLTFNTLEAPYLPKPASSSSATFPIEIATRSVCMLSAMDFA